MQREGTVSHFLRIAAEQVEAFVLSGRPPTLRELSALARALHEQSRKVAVLEERVAARAAAELRRIAREAGDE